MGFVSILRHLLKDPEIGKLIVPIVPDEARTFGLESAIRQVAIYASEGQKYKPHDQDMLLYYREEQDGQILEEGITEAGSMASFTAAGTAYSNYRLPAIPFYMYYSMFGFQRVGDMIWAFADSRGKGFLMGGTAGRTTMLGEGLQHQDGHSHVLASTVPTCLSYDPAYVYELAVIVQDGIRRMYQESENVFYYITMYNEDYAMPAMPRRRSRRHRAGNLPLPGCGCGQSHGAALWQWAHIERSRPGARHSGREIRGSHRCLERNQLQRVTAGGLGRGAVESAASRRSRKRFLTYWKRCRAPKGQLSLPAIT